MLDSSALLCWIYDETGAARIEPLLHGAVMSTVNYGETIAKLIERGAPVELAVEEIVDFGINVISFDRAHAERSGLLRATTRHAGLSLGDRACLALALSRGARVVTTDQAWARIDVGCEVEVVR